MNDINLYVINNMNLSIKTSLKFFDKMQVYLFMRETKLICISFSVSVELSPITIPCKTFNNTLIWSFVKVVFIVLENSHLLKVATSSNIS